MRPKMSVNFRDRYNRVCLYTFQDCHHRKNLAAKGWCFCLQVIAARICSIKMSEFMSLSHLKMPYQSKNYFFGVPHLATCIFFLFTYWMNQDWVQESIPARLWHHFHLALDGIEPMTFRSWAECSTARP